MAKMEESENSMREKDREFQGLKEHIEEIRGLYLGLIEPLNTAVDLRKKIRANPQEFLEADPFKFIASQKKIEFVFVRKTMLRQYFSIISFTGRRLVYLHPIPILIIV